MLRFLSPLSSLKFENQRGRSLQRDRDRDMASTRVDSVLHHLKLLKSNLYKTGIDYLGKDFKTLKLHLRFMKTFLLCAGNWSDDQLKVSLRSLLSKIEATVHRPGKDIRIIYTRSKGPFKLRGVVSDSMRVFGDSIRVVSNLLKDIRSFKQEIINMYITLSSDPSSCLRDSELVGFIDSVVQNLVDLRRYFGNNFDLSCNGALYTHIEPLVDKLTFLKSFIGFAKFLGVEGRELEDLLAHTQVVALNAARLSYECLFYREDEEMHDPKVCSIISELLKKIYPVDRQVYETYVKVLKAPKSPESLLTMHTDMQLLRDFNDSLINSLWELQLCTTSFTVSMKDQMEILHEGLIDQMEILHEGLIDQMEKLHEVLIFLRSILNEPQEKLHEVLIFLRSILNEPQENMDELNDKIVAVLSEAGIVIFSVFLNVVKEVKVGSLLVGEFAECYGMLVNTNTSVKLIVEQLSGSSISRSLPWCQSFGGQEVSKTTHFKPSRGRVPIINDIVVGFKDEAEKVIHRLIGGPEYLEIVPIVGMPGLWKTTLAQKVYNDSSVRYHFSIRHWCSISQEYNMKNLLVQILCSDGKESMVNKELKAQSEDELVAKLYRTLKGNRYLVVVDDVWDIRAWHGLRYSFPDDRSGSRILLTSRDSNVASEVEFGGKPHNVRGFTEEESWELLERKVFGEADLLCGI